jgi:hypothetical protein
MDRFPPEAWRRLGLALERRRAELGYGFRQRGRFAHERGGGQLSIKTISRLEKGERDSYPEATVATAEAMYRWAPGSFASVLGGGEPNPLVSDPLTSAPVPPEVAPASFAADYATPTPGERIASWVYVRMRELGYGEEAIHELIAAVGLPREPTTISSVRRIAEATGASLAEVLALLGVEDINARRPTRPADGTGGTENMQAGGGFQS